MAARIYTVTFVSQTVANASGDYELVELDPTGKLVELLGMEIAVTSEVAEAQEEWCSIQVIRGHTTDGTGGTSTTPRPVDPDTSAATFTADVLRTGIATAGTAVTLWSSGFNVRAGYILGPAPEGFGLICRDADGLLVVRQSSTFADDVTMSATFLVREF